MEAAMVHRRMTVLATAITLIGVVVPMPAVAQAPEIATAVAFTEGPTVDRDGNVYFTEMVSQRILKVSANGVLSTFREHCNNANGLLVDPQGLLVACESADSQRTGVLVKFKPQITRTDLRTGQREVLADNYQGKPFVRQISLSPRSELQDLADEHASIQLTADLCGSCSRRRASAR